MKLSHSTMVVPDSLVDYVRQHVLRQINGLYDGKVLLTDILNTHRLNLIVMDNGKRVRCEGQQIVIQRMVFERHEINPENKYSAASALALAHLESDGKYIMPLALRFRVFLYQEHKPNAYIKAL